MDNSVFWKMAAVCSIFFCFTWSISAQVYTPNGSVNTSLNSNIGIGTNNPLSRLQVESDGTTGLLELNFTESQGQAGDGATGGGSSSTLMPAYAFKLNYAPLNLASSTRFTILGDGQTFIGDFAGVGSSSSTLNVRSSMTVNLSTSNAIQIGYSGTTPVINWNTSHNSNLVFSNGAANLMHISTNGQVGIGADAWGTELFKVAGTVRNEGVLIWNGNVDNTPLGIVNGLEIFTNGNQKENFAIKTHTYWGDVFTVSDKGDVTVNSFDVPNSGESKLTYGLTVKNDGYRGHDYILSLETAHDKVFTVGNSGYVHIGSNLNRDTPNGPYLLYVEGGIRTESVRADVATENGWADYVFKDNYKLMSIEEVAKYIEQNGHLPNVPSTKEVLNKGVDLVEMNRILLEKVEELTLLLIDINKRLKDVED